MEFTVYDIAVPAVIIGLVELLKRLGFPQKFAPVVAVVLGVVAGFVYLAPGDPKKAFLLGIALGLFCVGLYSGTKNVAEGLRGQGQGG